MSDSKHDSRKENLGRELANELDHSHPPKNPVPASLSQGLSNPDVRTKAHTGLFERHAIIEEVDPIDPEHGVVFHLPQVVQLLLELSHGAR